MLVGRAFGYTFYLTSSLVPPNPRLQVTCLLSLVGSTRYISFLWTEGYISPPSPSSIQGMTVEGGASRQLKMVLSISFSTGNLSLFP